MLLALATAVTLLALMASIMRLREDRWRPGPGRQPAPGAGYYDELAG